MDKLSKALTSYESCADYELLTEDTSWNSRSVRGTINGKPTLFIAIVCDDESHLQELLDCAFARNVEIESIPNIGKVC